MSTLKVDTIKSDTTPTVTISDGLSVSGVTTTTGNIHLNSTDKKIYLTSDYDQYITANAASNYLAFAAGNSERLRIKSDGKIAAGTAGSTDGIVEVYNGTSKINLLTLRTGAGSGGYGGLAFASNTSHAREKAAIYFQETNGGAHFTGALVFATNGTSGSATQVSTSDERMRITPAGLVGINTDTPGTNHNLEIFGNASAYAVLNVKSQSLSHGASIELGAQDDDNYGAITQFASGASEGGRMKFVAGTTETLNLRGGKVLIGTTSDTSPIGWGNNLQVASTSATAGVSIRRDSADTGGALLVFGKSRGSLNGNTVVQDGDQIGGMYFAGADGTDVNSIAAQISVEVDGTPGGNDMPGRLIFKTTADGAASPTERMRIKSTGKVWISSEHGSSAIFGANLNDDTVLSNSGGLWNSSATNFLEISNTGDGISGKEAGILFRTRTSGAGVWAQYGARTGTFLSDMVFRTRTDSTANAEKIRFLNSGGITFNGDTAAANALDDYEEGNYSPTLQGSTSGDFTLNGSYDQLAYTKIGRVVHVSGRIRVTADNSAAGSFVQLSLPTTSASLGEDRGRVTGSVIVQYADIAVNNFAIHPTIEGNSYVQIGKANGTSFGNDGTDEFDGNELIAVNITYVSA